MANEGDKEKGGRPMEQLTPKSGRPEALAGHNIPWPINIPTSSIPPIIIIIIIIITPARTCLFTSLSSSSSC